MPASRPPLPAELQLEILRLSTTSASFSSSKERSTALRSYSLVSYAWREHAQKELFAHVALRSTKRSRQLLRAVQGSKRLASLVNTLLAEPWLNPGYAGVDEFVLRDLLKACDRLACLSLTRFRLYWRDLVRMLTSSGLTSVHLAQIHLADSLLPPPLSTFPHVRHLSLHFVRLGNEGLAQINSTTFPSLISLTWSGNSILAGSLDSLPPPPSFIPTLRAYATTDPLRPTIFNPSIFVLGCAKEDVPAMRAPPALRTLIVNPMNAGRMDLPSMPQSFLSAKELENLQSQLSGVKVEQVGPVEDGEKVEGAFARGVWEAVEMEMVREGGGRE